MVTMHDAMETCADNAMAVQRTTPVYTQPPDYAREHGELDKYRESNRLNVLCKEAIEQAVRDNYRDNRLDADAVWRDVTAQFGSKRAAFVLAMTVRDVYKRQRQYSCSNTLRETAFRPRPSSRTNSPATSAGAASPRCSTRTNPTGQRNTQS